VIQTERCETERETERETATERDRPRETDLSKTDREREGD